MKNKRLLRHLLGDSRSNLAERLLEEKMTLLRDSVLGTGCTEDEADLCYSYLCGSLARLWVRWIASGCKVPKEKVALTIEEILNWYYSIMSSGFITRQLL